MRLTGRMVIRLTDAASGEVETVEEENMVTDALDNILLGNPMGALYYGGRNIVVNKSLLPICPNTLGGIFLFSDPLEERKDNLYPLFGNYPIAYAANDVNPWADTARGSMNLTESGPINSGYKFVWDFSTSQGNGTIAAAALTSSWGGKNVYGSPYEDGTSLVLVQDIDITGCTREQRWILSNAVTCDFERELIYSINCDNNGIVTIKKSRLPILRFGVNDRLDDSSVEELESHVLDPASFSFSRNLQYYGIFLDGGDGFWYGFSNLANSSGNASVKWMKISRADYSFTEGTWTLSNTQLSGMGNRDTDYSLYKINAFACIRDGYLYALSHNKSAVYKINLANQTDVTSIPLGFTSKGYALSDILGCLGMALVGDVIMGYDFLIMADDTAIRTPGGKCTERLQTPLFCYKNFCIGWGTSNRYVFLRTPYLGTINNLSSAVVKTADKSMKITYTLTEENA